MSPPRTTRWQLAACLLLLSSALGAQEPPAPPREDAESPLIAAPDAERLFLDYIGDPKNLIRSCMFLGGVRVEEISGTNDLATAKIRYRIECVQEEISMPPLTRSLTESFVYRYRGSHWEILGRASEISPAVLEGSAQGRETPARPRLDPVAADRRIIAEKILAWAVLGRRPEGVRKPFPGGDPVARKSPVLVSRENLIGVEALSVPGNTALLLPPEALLQRTLMESGGVWFRFETLDLSGDSARVVVSLVSPIIPPPRPGAERVRPLSRVEGNFLRRDHSWVLTGFRPLI